MVVKENVLRKNAKVSILFQVLEGYLFEGIFVEVENGQMKNIYTNGADLSVVGKVLYDVERELDSLGLDLKNNPFEVEEIESKLTEAFGLQVVDLPYAVIDEGEEIGALSVQEENEVETVEDTVEETPAVANDVDFSAILQQAQEEPEATKEVEVEALDETPETEETHIQSSFFDEEETEEGTSPSISEEIVPENPTRQEKQIFTKKFALEYLRSCEQVVQKTNEIAEYVQERIDVSNTHVRNMIEEMPEEVIKISRGKYALKSRYENLPIGNAADGAMKREELNRVQEQVEFTAPTPTQTRVVEEAPATEYPKYFFDNETVEEYLGKFSMPDHLKRWTMLKRTENAERVKQYPQHIVDTVPNEISFLGDDEVLTKALASMMAKFPLSLKGPAGTGKTTLVSTICALLNIPLFTVNGSLESNKGTLVGELDIKEKGIISVKDGQMTKAALFGGMLYIDEINMMRPDVLSIVNSFTDHRREFSNDVRGELIKLHPETRFVSAMNVGYAGVKKMNEATMNRTVTIELSYLKKPEVRELLNVFAEQADTEFVDQLSPVEIEKLAKLYGVLSVAVQQGVIPHLAASTRNIVKIAGLAPIIGFQDAIEMVLDNFDEQEADAIAGVITKDGLGDELGFSVA